MNQMCIRVGLTSLSEEKYWNVSNDYQSTCHHNPEHHGTNLHDCENL